MKVTRTGAVAVSFRIKKHNWWQKIKYFLGWGKPEKVNFIHTVSVIVDSMEEYNHARTGHILQSNGGLLWYLKAKAIINDKIFLLESLQPQPSSKCPELTDLVIFASSFQES